MDADEFRAQALGNPNVKRDFMKKIYVTRSLVLACLLAMFGNALLFLSTSCRTGAPA
jgi:hypothetical protein